MSRTCCLSMLIVLLLSYGTSTASGQAIPVDIPDKPGESPADREREKLTERHRVTLSRFFGTTSLSASPLMHESGFVFDTILEGGVQLGNGDALYLVVGGRSTPLLNDDRPPWAEDREYGGLFALGYELGLARFSARPMIQQSVFGLSIGGWYGNTNLLTVDLSPRYLLPVNQYWSLPVGLKMTTVYLSESARPLVFVGLSMGVRRHFGQRKSLE